ncbi:Uncharacterised protein [uncultured archaeon]|nr:Uncharacterised protein [uncultured archaeon]
MLGYTYSYLLLGILFFVFWIILFLWRKDTRKPMLLFSSLFGFAGPLADLLYTQDWWKPVTITNTAIGLESIFVGFMIGGIATVLYEDIFKKKIRLRKNYKSRKEKDNLHLILLILTALILFFGSFYLLRLNSLVSTIIALIIPTLYIWYKRKDLIVDSLMSGVLLLVLSFLVYSTLNLITPGWVDEFWYFRNVPHLIFLGVPIDDVIWYFLAGAFIAPLYEYWLEGRLINKK